MTLDAIPIFKDEESRALVRTHCERIGITLELLEEMIYAEMRVLGMGRRHGIFKELEEILINFEQQ
jgi:hypothetical protein